MNPIQIMNRIDFYNDSTRVGRYYFADYNKAVNSAIKDFIDSRMGDEPQRQPDNFQWIQQIRDDLYTLIKSSTLTPTNGTAVTNRYYSHTPSHINFPADYYDFVALNVLIDSYTTYSRPTDYNEVGPLLEDSFRHPTNQKTYYNEDSTGLTIWRGVGGTFSSASLQYIKTPNSFSIGSEAQQIFPGGAVLTNGLSYYAIDVSVQSGVTYQIGDQFTAVGTALTSGVVILASNTTALELPEKVHDEICKAASRIMLLVTANYTASQAVESERKMS
jgi:hypothetical protein